MAAANAQIGVATAAFCPNITTVPTLYGGESVSLSSLFNAPSLIWAAGVTALQPLYDAGRIPRERDRASAQAQVAIESTRRMLVLANDRYEGGVAN